MAQRLVRAKRKITSAGIPLTIPESDQLPARLDDVLTVIYLAYNAGYLTVEAQPFAGDAVWLGQLVAEQLSDQPEACGLLSLLTLHSRTAARFDSSGRLCCPTRIGRAGIETRSSQPTVISLGPQHCAVRGGSGCRRRSLAVTPWPSADRTLTRCRSSPCTTCCRSMINPRSSGSIGRSPWGMSVVRAAVLAEVDLVAERLDDYHLLHATRAKLLTELRGPASAQQANLRALELATNPAEQDLLRSRQTAETGQLRLATCTV